MVKIRKKWGKNEVIISLNGSMIRVKIILNTVFQEGRVYSTSNKKRGKNSTILVNIEFDSSIWICFHSPPIVTLTRPSLS